ncbi:hypothetical protein KC318_g9421, partial [Hortaea werneckii]
MVRNTASMQSLRDSMSQHSLASPSHIETTPDRRPSGSAIQQGRSGEQSHPYVNLNGPLPLHGTNDYTKSLMTRIATGQATAEERARWEEHVAAVRARPVSSVHNNAFDSPRALPTAAAMDQQQPAPLASPPNTLTTPQHQGHPNALAMQDFQMQLMLLEEQNKRRLEQARELQEAAAVPSIHQPVNAGQARVNPQFIRDMAIQGGGMRSNHQYALRSSRTKKATPTNADEYTEPFCKFLTENPTVFHAVDAVKKQLKDSGFTELSERDRWNVKPSGSYFVERNGSSLIAFTVGGKYEPGNGAAILAGHVDALTAKLKPISQVPNKAGYVQLGVAPYAGAPNTTW